MKHLNFLPLRIIVMVGSAMLIFCAISYGQNTENKIVIEELQQNDQEENYDVIYLSKDEIVATDIQIDQGLSEKRNKQHELQHLPPSSNSEAELNLSSEETSSKKVSNKTTSTFIVQDLIPHTIANLTSYTYALTPSVSIPSDAIITNFIYRVRVDDDGDISTFYPSDYKILLSAESKPGAWLVVYDDKGLGHLDDNYDDDEANDTDIYLEDRTTSWFDGDPADQTYYIRIWDEYPSPSSGKAAGGRVEVTWESPDPNLDAGYTPPGWDGPMVLNHTSGSKSNSATLYGNTSTYFNNSYQNQTKDIPASPDFSFTILLDGTALQNYERPGATANYYYTFENKEYVITPGEHEVCQHVDRNGEIYESDETDNLYCETLTWQDIPSAPTGLNPSNGSSCQEPSLTLNWADVPYALMYAIQVDNNSDFSSPLIERGGITESQTDISGLAPNTRYYWRVRGFNPAGIGIPTDAHYFTSRPLLPLTPELVSPESEVGCQPTTLTLNWSDEATAETYGIQVDNNSDFSSPEINESGISESEIEISSLSTGILYYWRVRAINSCGGGSPWSSDRQFTTAPASPGNPEPSSPENGATCQTLSQTLSWNSVSGASHYNIQLDDNDDFSSIEEEFSGISATSVAVDGLDAGTRYYWRVIARNICNSYSGWSGTQNFSTLEVSPTHPSLSSPADEASCQALSLELTWSAVSGAISYILEVDTDSDFGSPIITEDGISSNSNMISDLLGNTQYFWRIKAVNSCGSESAWSSSRSFYTLISSLTTPTLSGPENAGTCLPTSPTLTWVSVTNADEYSVEVDDNSDFSSPEFTGLCDGSSINCSALSESSNYYWRVAASDDCGTTSAWSETWSFETGANNMGIPVLSEPENSSTIPALNTSLSWGTIDNAVNYQVQVDEEADFSSPIYDDEISSTSLAVNNLDQGTSYYWQVRAIGDCASSSWSESWVFETKTENPNFITKNMLEGYHLIPNRPNPFSKTTAIGFKIPVAEEVIIQLFDMQGKLIETSRGYYPAGQHEVVVGNEVDLSAGVYLYRMQTTNFTDIKPCIVR